MKVISSHRLIISDIEILFPYKPYECQITYMKHGDVMTSIQAFSDIDDVITSIQALKMNFIDWRTSLTKLIESKSHVYYLEYSIKRL